MMCFTLYKIREMADVTMCKYCIKGQYIKVTYLKNRNPMYFQS